MDQQIVSGIYDFPAREYNGDEGRWPSPDPAGLASVNPADPQTWNRYAYVRNAPLFMTDPTGMGDDWGGANGEDPYCLEDFCANGMPDYYGNDYNANDWVQAPHSGFGCMWNSSINTLRCPTNDCVPSTDAFGCASFYGGPRTVSPTWAFLSTFFGGLVSESGWNGVWHSLIDQNGCDREMFATIAGDLSPVPLDAGNAGGASDLTQAGIQALPAAAAAGGMARAYAYSASQGLTMPMKSTVYRVLGGEAITTSDAVGSAVLPISITAAAAHGLYTAGSNAYNGTCH